MPPKKRKSNDYLDQIMDMKRKREAGGQPDDLDEGGVRGDNVGPSFEFSAIACMAKRIELALLHICRELPHFIVRRRPGLNITQ